MNYTKLLLFLAVMLESSLSSGAFTSTSISRLSSRGSRVGDKRPSSNTLPARKHHSNKHVAALLDPSIILSSDSLSPDSIHTAFSVATFLPQPFWLFIIFLPNAKITKQLMGGMEVVTLFALVHFFIVASSIVQPGGTAPLAEFNDVFNPAGDPQGAFMGMMKYPNFVSEEWSHVLTWDLFVGRWIWLDGLKRGIFTAPSVLLCNLIGPPGLLLHWATCIASGKGLVPNEALEDE